MPEGCQEQLVVVGSLAAGDQLLGHERFMRTKDVDCVRSSGSTAIDHHEVRMEERPQRRTERGAIGALRAAIERAVPYLKQLKGAHWPQHGNTVELHELNYLFAVPDEPRRDGALVDCEVPVLGRKGATGRRDALALHEQEG